MAWGFLAAKNKSVLVLLNRCRLESWALAFPEDHKTLLSRASSSFSCKEHENRHSSSGGHWEKGTVRCPTPAALLRRLEWVLLFSPGQARARQGARQEDTMGIDAESTVLPSPSLPSAPVQEGPGTRPGRSVSDPPAYSDSLNSHKAPHLELGGQG